MNNSNYDAAILFISATLDDLNCNFKFWNSNTAAYEGKTKTFYFPHLPLDVTEKTLDYIWGFVYHELGHALYTDFDALSKAVKLNPLTEGVYRVFEDVWQEYRYNSDIPYSFRRLSKLSEVLAQDNLLGTSNASMQPKQILRNFFLNYGYSAVVKHKAVDDFAIQDEKLMLDVFSPGLVVKLKNIVLSLKDCESSFDVLSLAQMVNTAFEDEKEKEQSQNQHDSSSQSNADSSQDDSEDDSSSQSNADSSQDDSEDDSSSQSNANGSQDNSEDDSSDQSNANGSQDDSEDDSSSQSNLNGSQDGSEDDSSSQSSSDGSQDDSSSQSGSNGLEEDKQVNSNYDNVLNSDDSDFDNMDRGDLLQSALSDAIEEDAANSSTGTFRYQPPGKSDEKALRDNLFLSKGERVASGLIPRFKRLFESKAKVRKTRHQIGKKLVRNSTVKMMTRDPNLFVRKSVKTTVDTHISVVLDNSGSMECNDRLDIALDAVSAIGLAAEKTRGVDFSACSFPDTGNSETVDVLCTENERFSMVSSRFNKLDSQGYSTPMAHGFLWAMQQCSKTINPRKVIIILTDGSPDYEHVEVVKEMEKKCRLRGIEVWAIGIQEESVRELFTDYMVIDDVQELPVKLLQKLTSAII